MIDTSVFRTGQPVYIDFPFEDVMFRYENGRAYRKFCGETAYSGAWRSPFRGDGDRDSELMPITIPS